MMEQVNIPEGQSGPWKIERFTVSEAASKFDRIRCFSSGISRYTPPGTYTRLTRGITVVMSDTPDEMRDHSEPVFRSTGSVLINGLGLGMVLKEILKKPDVTDVTVVEMDQNVISLVAPFYTDPRVTIVHANALEYQPPKGKRYQAVWHDIWDGICSDNLTEMAALHRKYGRRCDWQGSWCRWQCERAKRLSRY